MNSSFFDRLFELLQYNPEAPMLFNSGFFLFFFFICILFYQFIVHNKRARVLYLLSFSLFFYYKSSGFYFILVIVSSIIDFIAGHVIDRTENPGKKKTFLIISLITNLGLLGYFKYTNFIFDTINSFGGNFGAADIFLPVGISFFTFQSMSYTIDIYRNKLAPEKNFFDFLFFVSFFPQLVAGPIVRASDFLPQIDRKIVVSKADIGRAVFLIIGGLFKKAVIADYISINFIDRVFEMPLRYTGFENLMALYGYALQIYCDFSGYSDMAIGLALLLGFNLPINFRSPYQSASITEFWRRWHISLSTWLKDYLYIPLGGNRKGKLRQYMNLIVTMLLGGLWHGASWKFVVWGGIHGLALAVEKLFNIPEKVGKSRLVRFIGIVVTFHIACFCWIFFRAQSFEKAIDMIEQILFYFHGEIFTQFIEGYAVVSLMMLIGYVLHFMPESWELKMQGVVTRTPLVGKALMLVAIIWLVVQVKTSGLQPFIYFQF